MTQPVPPVIKPRHAIAEFFRVAWYLRSVFAALFVVFVLLATAMYRFGAPVDLITRARVSFGEVLYFCSVTALTIGYGDVVPTTNIGRVLSVALGLLGVLSTGLITAVVVYAVQRAAGRGRVFDA